MRGPVPALHHGQQPAVSRALPEPLPQAPARLAFPRQTISRRGKKAIGVVGFGARAQSNTLPNGTSSFSVGLLQAKERSGADWRYVIVRGPKGKAKRSETILATDIVLPCNQL